MVMKVMLMIKSLEIVYLNNKLIHSWGLGVDMITFYDIVFKFDYSFNQLGRKRFVYTCAYRFLIINPSTKVLDIIFNNRNKTNLLTASIIIKNKHKITNESSYLQQGK